MACLASRARGSRVFVWHQLSLDLHNIRAMGYTFKSRLDLQSTSESPVRLL